MNVYKLRHKPTGLFFRPSYGAGKPNLGIHGKVYVTKPSVTFVENGYCGRNGKYVKYLPGEHALEWELVQYQVQESRVVPFEF